MPLVKNFFIVIIAYKITEKSGNMAFLGFFWRLCLTGCMALWCRKIQINHI